MKLKTLLTEFERMADRNEFKWHSSIGFDKQLRALRDFLKEYPYKSLIMVYKNAINDKKIGREELSQIRQAMSKERWHPEDIELMQ